MPEFRVADETFETLPTSPWLLTGTAPLDAGANGRRRLRPSVLAFLVSQARSRFSHPQILDEEEQPKPLAVLTTADDGADELVALRMLGLL